MAGKVHPAFYWKALRLSAKRDPFHSHPAMRASIAARRS
jgi:hypothetical protein